MGVNQLNRQNFDGNDVYNIIYTYCSVLARIWYGYCARVSVTNVAEKPKYYTANSNPEQWDSPLPQIDQRLQW